MEAIIKDLEFAIALPQDDKDNEIAKIAVLEDAIITYIMAQNEIGSEEYQNQLVDDACLYETYEDPDYCTEGQKIVGFLDVSKTYYTKEGRTIVQRTDMVCAYVIEDEGGKKSLGTYQWYGRYGQYKTKKECDESWERIAECAHDEHHLFDMIEIAKFILKKSKRTNLLPGRNHL